MPSKTSTNYAVKTKRSNDRESSRSPSDANLRRKVRSRSRERGKEGKKYSRRKSSSTSSTSSEEEREFNQLLAKKRIEKIIKEKEVKRRLKEIETPDEKRARRLAKKLQKVGFRFFVLFFSNLEFFLARAAKSWNNECVPWGHPIHRPEQPIQWYHSYWHLHLEEKMGVRGKGRYLQKEGGKNVS